MGGVVTGRSAVALPWLCPSADALLTLTDPAPVARTLSGDLAFCAHLARFLRPSLTPTCRPFDAGTLAQPSLVAAAALTARNRLLKRRVAGRPPPGTHSKRGRPIDGVGRTTRRGVGRRDPRRRRAGHAARLPWLGGGGGGLPEAPGRVPGRRRPRPRPPRNATPALRPRLRRADAPPRRPLALPRLADGDPRLVAPPHPRRRAARGTGRVVPRRPGRSCCHGAAWRGVRPRRGGHGRRPRPRGTLPARGQARRPRPGLRTRPARRAAQTRRPVRPAAATFGVIPAVAGGRLVGRGRRPRRSVDATTG